MNQKYRKLQDGEAIATGDKLVTAGITVTDADLDTVSDLPSDVYKGCIVGKIEDFGCDVYRNIVTTPTGTVVTRAKVRIDQVTQPYEGAEEIIAYPVCYAPFGPNGESEDNTFARYTPAGEIKLTIQNPSLLGVFKPGQRYYVDFTAAPAPAS